MNKQYRIVAAALNNQNRIVAQSFSWPFRDAHYVATVGDAVISFDDNFNEIPVAIILNEKNMAEDSKQSTDNNFISSYPLNVRKLGMAVAVAEWNKLAEQVNRPKIVNVIDLKDHKTNSTEDIGIYKARALDRLMVLAATIDEADSVEAIRKAVAACDPLNVL